MPWVPVVALGAVSLVVALVVAVTHAWAVLVAVGAALEAMIYAVAAFCTVRLRSKEPDAPRPFSVPAIGVVGTLGVVIFSVLAVIASVSVNNHFNPAPLVIIAVGALISLYYVLRILPRVAAKEQARRAATPRRRPPRAPSPPTHDAGGEGQ